MTGLQNNIASTWLIGPATFFVALYIQDSSNLNWALIMVVGFGVCRYLRRELPEMANSPMEIMLTNTPIASVIYYIVLFIAVAFLVYNYPDKVDYNFFQFVLFLGAIILPFTPSLIKHEINIFKQARNT